MSEEIRTITTGLGFPEGPVVLPDGAVALVEIAKGTVTRVDPTTGETTTIATTGGGPNGLALDPDGATLYVCNNGAYFSYTDAGGITVPAHAEGSEGGSIQKVDIASGAVEVLYTASGGADLVAPNDLVLDGHGGFWFTDFGVTQEHHPGKAGVHYATVDGASVTPAGFDTNNTNGVGLSPAGDRLYVAETYSGTVWAWDVTAPGVLAEGSKRLLYDAPEGHLFDSLQVDDVGRVCVATIGAGGITVLTPDGDLIEHRPLPDPIVTNICFGGGTAYITGSGTGVLFACDWPT